MVDSLLHNHKYYDIYTDNKIGSSSKQQDGSRISSRRSSRLDLSASSDSLLRSNEFTCRKTPLNSSRLPKYREKGLVFIWPQRRKFYHTRELINITWFLAHALYFLHIIHFFPSGAAVPVKRPPWKYTPPLPKPENRDYIIEPDWDS